ncbi:MAG: hypothetical protein ABJG78_20535 [Cyclobacteriaceae bacterium]
MLKILPPREVTRPGGLYYKEGYVFVLELGQEGDLYNFRDDGSYEYNLRLDETGIHVIDDTNPATPVHVAFINIPGINGITARGNKLYADSFTDLLVFDISNPSSPELTNRVKNVYKNLSYAGFFVDENLGIVTGFESTPVKYENEICDDAEIMPQYYYEDMLSLQNSSSEGGGAPSTGTSGSLARFVTVGDYLYNIDYSDLHLFDISGASPEKISDIHIGWQVETIYPYEDKLFFGSFDGMYIYDNSNPADPKFLSKYEHVTSCDPVVVQGDYAYVTLRSGTTCQGFTNQLDIVNVANPETPFLEKTYQMDNPHGLSIFNQCLYVCEGAFGLKSFNVDQGDPTKITHTSTQVGIHALDVIALPNMLMIVGNDGFYQYSRSCGSALEYLGVISY